MFINDLPVSSLFCYTTLLCLPHCLHAHLLTLSILIPFMLCVPCPFNAPFLFCAFQQLHSTSFYTLESCSTAQPISSLFCIHIVSLNLVHAISSCLCMLSPSRVLYLIIMPTLQFLWKLNTCIHHHWVLFSDSFTSPAVETLRLLCYSRAQPLYCSYKIQHPSICQSPL
jgi:hypothetical protein